VLRSVRRLVGFSLGVSDGALGRVGNLVFDARTWTVRYVVVETGEWTAGLGAGHAYVTEEEVERVLVSPTAVTMIDAENKQLSVSLTRSQVRKGWAINPDQPISRQLEERLQSSKEGSQGPSPIGSRRPATALHLVTDMFGCHLEATDGAIGHVTDLVVDDKTWTLRYAVVTTHNWWPGQHVLIAPAWIARVQWRTREAFVDRSRKEIKSAPAWNPRALVGRPYEKRLYDHYGQPTYW
jgi:hypothetical protein